MRWFKHLTGAHHDERMARLVTELGLEGYGFYWLVLETVAGQIEPGSNHTSLGYPITHWRKITGLSLKKLRKFVEICAELGIFTADFSENLLTINIPNILKYRDEWSRKKGGNSGVTPESLRSKDLDTDTEKEEEGVCLTRTCAREEAADPAQPPPSEPKKTDSPTKGNPQWPAFLSCWEVYPVKQGQEEAWREWMRLHENRTLAEPYAVRDAILLLQGEDSRWQRGMVPKMARWLSGKGWDDQPFREPEQDLHARLPQQRDGPRATTQAQKASQARDNMARNVAARRGIDVDAVLGRKGSTAAQVAGDSGCAGRLHSGLSGSRGDGGAGGGNRLPLAGGSGSIQAGRHYAGHPGTPQDIEVLPVDS